MSRSIRIAICGGGLAGASLLHALLPYTHLDVHIFESAAAFKETGMAIGVARNALAALDLIGHSAAQCLERAGAVPMRGVRFMLAQGEGAGNMIDETNDEALGERVTSIVHRAAFLRELLAGVPQERMHAGKKLDKIDRNSDESITLHFTDGTTHECDILIGADGIRSTVRQLILGEDDPAALPRNTGSWAVMTLKPYADAQASIGKGPVNIEDAREYMWIGDGTYLMHNVLNQGQLVQFVIASHEKDAESSDRWHRVVSRDEIKNLYQAWPPHLYKAVDELLCDRSEQPAMYLWEHPPARTYTSGSVCIMGDAAHATTPWQGSGGGMSIEDSHILSTLLGRAKTPAEALAALKVYDQVRRPRTQRIVESSRATGLIVAGLGEQTKLDIGKLRENVLPRWDFIIDFDNEKHRDEAVEMMERELKS
ncbi:6-methylsalicylic acid decarboxylase atA [Lachnellula arida]|uniref:6-methylsalicylic acid decarboxylase atA n=1 Tax=Lachnellula arida TaxID=1316785 RepID=A0A8T9B2S1_9HELO|nr:6-methylsalicylic acid decarboxylase atA [Lachnellula arida]